jgi:hypothetical protein
LVAGSRFPEVVALAPSFPGTLWVAVFDEGAAGGAFSRVFVARQDFQALGEGAARLLFDGLTNPGGERRDLLVPIKDIVDETGTRN